MNSELKNNKRENLVHTILLVLGMVALMSAIGWVLLGKWGFAIAVGLTLFGLVMGPRVSSGIVLRMYKARRIERRAAPELIDLFQELVRRGEVDPMPGLYYIPSGMPNAFAVGVGNSAAVAITHGLLHGLNPRELAGVLAHEIAHLKHKDTRVMGLADIVARVTSLFARIGIFMLLFSGANILMGGGGIQFALAGLLMVCAPTIIALMQLALSRSREFNADMGAVEITGDPMGLASALQKIELMAGALAGKVIKKTQLQQPAFLRTHPPTADRIRELNDVAEENAEARKAIAAAAFGTRSDDPEVVFIGEAEPPRPAKYYISTGVYR